MEVSFSPRSESGEKIHGRDAGTGQTGMRSRFYTPRFGAASDPPVGGSPAFP